MTGRFQHLHNINFPGGDATESNQQVCFSRPTTWSFRWVVRPKVIRNRSMTHLLLPHPIHHPLSSPTSSTLHNPLSSPLHNFCSRFRGLPIANFHPKSRVFALVVIPFSKRHFQLFFVCEHSFSKLSKPNKRLLAPLLRLRGLIYFVETVIAVTMDLFQ